MTPTTLDRIRALAAAREVLFTLHARRELAEDRIPLAAVVDTVDTAVVVEDYPTHGRGPCVLVRQTLGDGSFVRIVWGIRFGQTRPAAVITGYRPEAGQWSSDFTQRRH